MPTKKFYLLSLLFICASVANAAPSSFSEYLIAADTVFLSDYTKTLGGSIYGNDIEIGVDAKVYGSISAGSKCFLRERASISDTLSFPFTSPCSKQNNVSIDKEISGKAEYSKTDIASFSSGSQNISIAIGAGHAIPPGSHGNLRIGARSTVRLQSGTYIFSSIHTEPDVKWHFDLGNGPVKIYVLDGIKFADRNVFSISGGNPSEIEWIIASGNIDIGTDGKFFGRFTAPNSYVRLAPRSHVVGGIEARRFQMEPQSTVSTEPRAEEISHSEYNFGPFWSKNNFRYLSAQPFSVDSVDMYIYAGSFTAKVNGSASRGVKLSSTSQTVFVSVSRSFIADFPPETFSSIYSFAFDKTSSNRIYWHPGSPCSYGCDGLSAEKAVRQLSQALALAQKSGMEVKISGGEWKVTDEYRIFPVGLELVGNESPFWELSSFSDVPVLNARSHGIEIAGRSPRKLTGLHITGGMGGALKASVEKLELASMAFTNNSSNSNGGSLRYDGSGLLKGKVLLFENGKGRKGGGAFIGGNAEIEDLVCSDNTATAGEGGCLSVQGSLRLTNAVFSGNKSKKEGGAFYAKSTTVFSATAAGNESVGGNAFAGSSGSVNNSIFRNNSGGDIPSSWTAQYSFFPSSRSGIGNASGDPKFTDEKNPSGSAHFFGYDAGLILADKSPALASKADVVPERDLLGTERSNAVAMGAYGDYNDDGSVFVWQMVLREI